MASVKRSPVAFITGWPSGLVRNVELRDNVEGRVVEVKGLSYDEVETALRLFSRTRQVSAETAQSTYEQLLAVLLAEGEHATDGNEVQAAKGLAAVRAHLLSTPYFTYDALAQRRHAKPNAIKTWVKRLRDAHSLFSVQHGGRALLPAFQFDDDGEPREAVSAVVRTLRGVDVDGWQLWEWFASPTSWLDGDSPVSLLDEEPDLVLTTAQQRAEELEISRTGARKLGQLAP
jgi:hypothetical protein